MKDLVDKFQRLVDDAKYKKYLVMVYHPDHRALFYRLTKYQTEKLGKLSGEIILSSNNELKIIKESKYFRKLFIEYKTLYGENRFAEWDDLENDPREYYGDISGSTDTAISDSELLKEIIECIPQALRIGVAGECADSRYAYIVPESSHRDYRRRLKKIYGSKIYDTYYQYYKAMQEFEKHLLGTGHDSGAFIAPLIESGQLRGVLFLMDKEDMNEVNSFNEQFIESIDIARKTSEAIQDIRDQYFRVKIAEEYINANMTGSAFRSNGNGNDSSKSLSVLITNYIHFICNAVVTYSVTPPKADSPKFNINYVWFIDEYSAGRNPDVEYYLKGKGYTLDKNCTLSLYKANKVEVLVFNIGSSIIINDKYNLVDTIKPVALEYNDVKADIKIPEYLSALYNNLGIVINTVLIIPIPETDASLVKTKNNYIVVFLEQKKCIIEANLVSIWKKISPLIMMNQYTGMREKVIRFNSLKGYFTDFLTGDMDYETFNNNIRSQTDELLEWNYKEEDEYSENNIGKSRNSLFNDIIEKINEKNKNRKSIDIVAVFLMKYLIEGMSDGTRENKDLLAQLFGKALFVLSDERRLAGVLTCIDTDSTHPDLKTLSAHYVNVNSQIEKLFKEIKDKHLLDEEDSKKIEITPKAIAINQLVLEFLKKKVLQSSPEYKNIICTLYKRIEKYYELLDGSTG